MPIGIQRLNARQQLPNERIIFIKALPGPDHATALDFLNRIAAICTPIMKANHLSVMTLEEHEPNAEFVGRNFNAGEIVQLVLKSRGGRWLPFRCVQMVMMHELAHCEQMNHSRAFWKVRNQYADELRVLWAKHYTGEGLWGRGQSLYNGQYADDATLAAGEMPVHLCGGTYRSSRRGKRKRRTTSNLSYAERKQKWIAKKFGAGGVSLGNDDDKRVELEQGKKVKGKPRVAQSSRGRELRAAAALARLDKAKEDIKVKPEFQDDSDETDLESDYDEPEIKEEALDHDGSKLLDSKGRSMVKVCEDENPNEDPDAQNELKELRQISIGEAFERTRKNVDVVPSDDPPIKDEDDVSTESEAENEVSLSVKPVKNNSPTDARSERKDKGETLPILHISDVKGENTSDDANLQAPRSSAPKKAVTCPICSLENPPQTLTCAACAHVLDTSELSNHWRCGSKVCVQNGYVNADDAGVCGICGMPKEA